MPSILLNDLAPTVSLTGDWEFQLADHPPHSIPVPSAWEAHLADKTTDGPALYRRRFSLPESGPNAIVVLEADAVSFEAEVRVNGHPAGAHRGMWSPFQIDITPYAQLGENTLEIDVWKPGGRFPIRETLSGFLPDVATTFGGIWQPIRLRALGLSAFSNLKVFAYGGGWLDVQGRVARMGERRGIEVQIEVQDDTGRPIARARPPLADDQSFAAHLEVGGVARWRPGPGGAARYTVIVSQLVRGAEVVRVQRRTGFRTFRAEGLNTLLNESPVHLRGVLDWGWEPDEVRPTIAREAALDKFAQARALGFNLVKLCLYVPDETIFEAADESGMMLWLEMPLWLPHLTPGVRDLALSEFLDVFRRLHHHPSIAVVSLGCELNSEADADFLRALHLTARAWFPNSLHCDNSGSAEAYGGVETSLADFYDYHFYSEPHFFSGLIDHFSRTYQPAKPWLFGEFCDADTLRDFNRLDPAAWWLADPVALDRDDFLATREYGERLRRAGVTDGGAALTLNARRQATAVRKFILEQARARFPSGGYVVSGWADTPITTSGVVDDRRELKFEPYEWQQFNADRVLLIDRERRRRWIAGGDRPAFRDPYTWRQGETAEIHLLLSNGAGAVENAAVVWELTDELGAALAQGDLLVGAVEGATVRDLAGLSLPMPVRDEPRPVEMKLRVELTEVATGQVQARNVWSLWALPRPEAVEVNAGPRPVIVRALRDELVQRVRAGERALVWLMRPDDRFTQPMPFWREAIHVFEPHALWERLTQPGYADLRFFSIATDFGIDAEALQAVLGPEARVRPVWRRFDARKMTWADYVLEAEVGAGRILVTSLHLDGGLGSQPQTFEASPMGAWLLHSLTEALAGNNQ